MLIWIAAGYLVFGLITASVMCYLTWRDGEDLLVGDLLIFAVRALTWPIGLWFLLCNLWPESIGDRVLIKGCRSAKVLRELKRDHRTE